MSLYSFLTLVALFGVCACTEPVENDPAADKDSDSAGVGDDEGDDCETHPECESGVCNAEGSCEDQSKIVYVDKTMGIAGACGEITSPCQSIELALSRLSANVKTIFINEGVYVERLYLDSVDVSIIGDGRAVLSMVEEDRDMDKHQLSLFTASNQSQIRFENIVFSAEGYDSERRYPIHAITLVAFDSVNSPSLILKDVLVTHFNHALNAVDAVNIEISHSQLLNNYYSPIKVYDAESTIIDSVYTANSSSMAVDVVSASISIRNSIFNEDKRQVISVGHTEGLNFDFVHNTVIYRPAYSLDQTVSPLACDDMIGGIVANNLIVSRTGEFSNDGLTDPCPTSNSIVSYDSPGDDNLWADPMFIDPSNNNFHLQSGSPAIDAASPLPEVLFDFDGDQRPMGEASDIGADEAE